MTIQIKYEFALTIIKTNSEKVLEGLTRLR